MLVLATDGLSLIVVSLAVASDEARLLLVSATALLSLLIFVSSEPLLFASDDARLLELFLLSASASSSACFCASMFGPMP